MQNIRTIAVFTDGLVICAVGVDGISPASGAVLPRMGLLGAALLAVIRPGQRAVRHRRQESIRKRATRLGPDATAAAFAKTRRKALAVPFSDVTGIALIQSGMRKLLAVHTYSPRTAKEQTYQYLNDLPPERLSAVLGPLIGDRLTVPSPA
jgi:hypothetical protein